MTAVVRRAMVALVLAFGLALMHGGIGQAMACSGMSQMASMAMPTGVQLAQDHEADAAIDHSKHHEPGDKPVAAHAGTMCVSTPAISGGGDTKAGATTALLTPSAFGGQPQHVVTISEATGRQPPPPDLISELCVIRR